LTRCRHPPTLFAVMYKATNGNQPAQISQWNRDLPATRFPASAPGKLRHTPIVVGSSTMSPKMQRRAFIPLLGGAAAAWPLAARAQERVRRIGVLSGAAETDPEIQARNAAFLQALQQLGWTDGRNVRIDHRWVSSDI
jgi:hypothetical protein